MDEGLSRCSRCAKLGATHGKREGCISEYRCGGFGPRRPERISLLREALKLVKLPGR
jgi:hypothetical protein